MIFFQFYTEMLIVMQTLITAYEVLNLTLLRTRCMFYFIFYHVLHFEFHSL